MSSKIINDNVLKPSLKHIKMYRFIKSAQRWWDLRLAP